MDNEHLLTDEEIEKAMAPYFEIDPAAYGHGPYYLRSLNEENAILQRQHEKSFRQGYDYGHSSGYKDGYNQGYEGGQQVGIMKSTLEDV